jgi:hypothetical protein
MPENTPAYPIINLTVEAAEAIKLISDTVKCDDPKQLATAMVEAFNAGTHDGHWWIDDYFMQDVSKLVFNDDDLMLPYDLPLDNIPPALTHYESALYRALKTIDSTADKIKNAVTSFKFYNFSKNADEITASLNEKYPALSSISFPLTSEQFERKAAAFTGTDSSGVRTDNLQGHLRRLRHATLNADLDETPLRRLVSAIYSHGIGIAQKKNTNNVVLNLKNTVMTHAEAGFSINNAHDILTDLQQSPYLDFCIAQGKDDFEFLSDDDLQKIEQEKALEASLTDFDANRTQSGPEDTSYIDDIFAEILAEENDPVLQAKETQAQKQLIQDAAGFVSRSAPTKADPEHVMAILSVKDDIDRLPPGNDDLAGIFITHKLDLHGYAASDLQGRTLSALVSASKEEAPYQPLFDVTTIATVTNSTAKLKLDDTPTTNTINRARR